MTAVLFVSYSGAFGGAERVLLDCVSAAVPDSVLACPEGELAARARADGVTVLTIRGHRLDLRASAGDRLLGPLRLLAHSLELRAVARSLGAEVVVGWGMRSALACLGLPAGVPFAVAHNDMLPGPLIGAAVRRAATRARVVVVPSRAVALDLDPRGAIESGRLWIVYPGVDPDRFAADRVPAQPPEVLVLGALVDSKRPELAVETVALARRRVPELRLRFVGAPLSADDPARRALRARAAELGIGDAVQVAGADPEPWRALASPACLLHCAPREAFGLVIVEALASGCPPVVPAAGGPLEIVDESCGRTYPPGDAAAAADAIAEIVTDPQLAAELSSAGRARARARFDRRRTIAGFAEALAPLAGEAPKAAPGAQQLAIVTVSHNSERELAALLASVRRHLAGVQVVVVDNCSSDASLEIAREMPFVTAVALSENVGFGRACNLGLAEVHAPAVAFLNPDVELVDRSLLALGTEALRDSRPARLLAPLVLNGDGSRQDSVHPAPSSAFDLVRSVIPPAAVPPPLGPSLWPWRSARPRRVGWAVGCALAGSTAMLRRLGPFDESIFLYGEDLELGLRAAQEGVETWFWPSARVIHHGAHSARSEFGFEPLDRLALARHDVVRRRLGRTRAAVDDRAQAITFGSRLALKRSLGLSYERERRQLLALRSARRAGRRP